MRRYTITARNNKMTTAIQNLVNKISDKQTVKEFGITEAYFSDGEFHITSTYDLHPSTVTAIETELRKYTRTSANDHYRAFTGTDHYYNHSLARRITYTTGVKQLAEDCGAYWLIDVVASYQYGYMKGQAFQVWQLSKNKIGNGAKVICTDSNDNKLASQRIPFTDFKYDVCTFYCVDGVIMLPSEY